MRELYDTGVAAALSNPERRVVEGPIVQASGISGLASGHGRVTFDRDAITIVLADTSNVRRVNYADVRVLQITGRGDVVTKTSSGTRFSGGGFGLKGMIEGIAVAEVLNAASTTTTERHQIETIFQLEWGTESVTLLHQHLLPGQLADLLSTVTKKIDAQRKPAPTATEGPAAQRHLDLTDSEKVCPFCAETIKKAAVKCRYCGSGL